MRILSAAALVGVLIVQPALAQSAPPQHVMAAIAAFDAATSALSVKTADGATLSITLVPKAFVIANEKRTLADIRPGDFVASAALKGKDGKLHAEEVRIFPEALRGLGEGQYGMDKPDRSMTNATVKHVRGASVATKSGTLKLTFHGSGKAADGTCTGHATGPGAGTCTGETEIMVGPKVSVTSWVLGDTSWLVPGMAVSIFYVTGPDGKFSTRGVVVERNGIKPLL